MTSLPNEKQEWIAYKTLLRIFQLNLHKLFVKTPCLILRTLVIRFNYAAVNDWFAIISNSSITPKPISSY